MFSEEGILEGVYEIRDGGSTIAGDIQSNVVSRVGVGGEEPLSPYTGMASAYSALGVRREGDESRPEWGVPPPRWTLPTTAT